MSAVLLLASFLFTSTAVLADVSTITAAPSATQLAARQAAATTYETTSPLPLTDYFYPYASQPYQVNPFAVDRGPQSGYNECNSTTEGPDSRCQTAVVNSIDDWCLWGAPGLYPNQTVGDVEAAVVAYCTKSGHGTRIFPPGTITALQFMRTPGYIQVVGLMNQTGINLDPSDYGGELDPHGADLAGNPLGGLVYSTGLTGGDNTTYIQSQSWNNFIGSDQFCFKVCDPSYSTDLNFCQNIFDLIGCAYNAPVAYEPGVFLSCEGDLQDEVGTYTSGGQTYTWSQPSVLPATSTLPWTPRIPASSNCVTYQSTDLFPSASIGYQSTYAAPALAAVTGASSSSQSGSVSRAASTGSKTASGSAASAAATSTSGAAPVFASTGLLVLVGGLIALLA